ncbi:MAG TPA: hypothetical protein DDZ53_12170 [Firmicutes bacterium]|nr:hypothetical protein [Bacillota bacterium]
MQYVILALDEFSVASRFFRSVSQAPAQATGFLTLKHELAELKLTFSNLRQLVPVPDAERPYIDGLASLTAYQAWLAGANVEPVFLGAFDVPLFGQGELYVTFDPQNINDTGNSWQKYSWLLITAGGEQAVGVWNEDATSAILFGEIPSDTHNYQANTRPPWQLFAQHKCDYEDAYEDDELDLFDEDEENLECEE